MPSSTKLPEPAPNKPGRPAASRLPGRPEPRTEKPAPAPARPAPLQESDQAVNDPSKKPAPIAAGAAATPPPEASSQQSDAPQEEYYDDRDSTMRVWMRNLPAWLISALFHMLLLLILAIFTTGEIPPEPSKDLSLATVESEVPLEEILETPVLDDFDPEEVVDEPVELTDPVEVAEAIDKMEFDSELLTDPSESTEADQMAKVEVNVDAILNVTGLATDVLSQPGSGNSDGKGMTGGRSVKGRKVAVNARGGTQSSEAAVEAALAWIASHQNRDGSWSFDHRHGGACNGQCSEPDSPHARYLDGATGLALLPFFGAGYTHMDGKYQQTIGRGIAFLLRHGKPTSKGLKFDNGYLYGHGIATIALCEAYGMSGDSTLHEAAQASLNYIVSQQSPKTGSFGYSGPGNDTSVLGWQMMAYKSGAMAGLYVPNSAVAGIHHNLDKHVGLKGQSGGTAFYGYRSPNKKASTTAIGTLSRMYMGWPKEGNAALEESVAYISRTGPSTKGMYFNYYATQVLFQYTDGEGPIWDKWNIKMRDFLIRTQQKQGHQVGSWNKSSVATHGGRLYATCMATMVLEVYYRHMPVYRKAEVKKGNNKEEDAFKIN